MGAFNVLITESVCTNCGVKSPARIQFKYGSTWQFKYRIGDTISWGGNDYGNPNLKKVKAYGIVESTTCPSCSEDKIPEEYDIFIENNIITGIAPMENINDYLAPGNTEYVSLQ